MGKAVSFDVKEAQGLHWSFLDIRPMVQSKNSRLLYWVLPRSPGGAEGCIYDAQETLWCQGCVLTTVLYFGPETGNIIFAF